MNQESRTNSHDGTFNWHLKPLAMALMTIGLSACNVSTVDSTGGVDTKPTDSAGIGDNAVSQSEMRTHALFAPSRAQLPSNIDLLFAKAKTTDGTASTYDSKPPVTTTINDLTGFSTIADIDLPLSARINADTLAGNVHLIQLNNSDDESLIDPLDLASITFASDDNNPVNTSLKYGTDFIAEQVILDSGATPAIRLLLKKPLLSNTKYVVALTAGIKDTSGKALVAAPEYEALVGNGTLFSTAFKPLRAPLQAWHKIAQGTEQSVANATSSAADSVVFSYAFTTAATNSVLMAMSAPELFVSNLLKNTAAMERALGKETQKTILANVLQGAGDGATERSVRLSEAYKNKLAKTLATGLIVAGTKQKVMLGSASFDRWNADNPFQAIPKNPNDWSASDYSNILAALKAAGSIDLTKLTFEAAKTGGALLKATVDRPQPRPFNLIKKGSVVIKVPLSRLFGAAANAESVQGMLSLPQFLPRKQDALNGHWTGSQAVGELLDRAFGNPYGTTPPKDSDGSLNVSARFPFAKRVGNADVPVLVTYPTDAGCTKPYKTVMFAHGFTANRTASLGVANALAKQSAGCFATVAIDFPGHGLDAAGKDRNGNKQRNGLFNAFEVAGFTDGTQTPFASTLAAIAKQASDASGKSPFAKLAERHENRFLNGQRELTEMVFTAGNETGNSGSTFLNPANLLQSRDHMRQAVMDLLNLNASLSKIDVDGDNNGDLDTNNVFFVGHSLGGIVGVPFVAINNAIAKGEFKSQSDLKPIKAMVIANAGGHIPKLIENSKTISERFLAGLQAKGLTQDSRAMATYLSVFAAALNDIDPLNYAALLTSTQTPVLMFELAGGGTIADGDGGETTKLPDALITAGGYPSDTVVPNSAEAPLDGVATGKSFLAGSTPLATQLGLEKVKVSISMGSEARLLRSVFKQGTHATFASADAITVFSAMMRQVAGFLRTNGQGLPISDDDLLKMNTEAED